MRLLLLSRGRKLSLIYSWRQDNLHSFDGLRDNKYIPKVRIRNGAVAYAQTRTHNLKFTIANQSPTRLTTAPQLGTTQ